MSDEQPFEKKHVGEYLPPCDRCGVRWHAHLLIGGLCPKCRGAS
jgi:hypothetical protein